MTFSGDSAELLKEMPWNSDGRNPEWELVPPPTPPPPNTTNDGRFSFSVPRPYATHAPVDGRVARTVPQLNRFTPGVCVGLNVYIERTTQRSSATVESCGSKLLISMPLCPCFLNSKGDDSKPPVDRSVRKSTALGR